jgi:ELWxxDGT repeat protein
MSASLLFLLPPLFGPQGLVSGTEIADINANPAIQHGYNEGIGSAGGLAYFEANDAANQEPYRVWRTDGTAAGTVQIASVALNTRELVEFPGGEAFFLADELGVGVGLWRSDGTPGGTERVLAPLGWSQEPHALTVYNGSVWFVAGLPGVGGEVWRHTPATGATGMVMELVPGPQSGASELFTGAGKLFVAGGGQTPLYASDGTAAGTAIVAEFDTALPSSYQQIAAIGTSRVLFDIRSQGEERGWYVSDGTPAGTFQLDLTFNNAWSVGAATKAYFTTGTTASVYLLWETDGTPAGTLPVNLPSTTTGQRVDFFSAGITIGDELFYQGLVPGAGFELCRTSGAAAGAALVADIFPGSSDSDPIDFEVVGDSVFFRASDGVHGNEVWRLAPATGAVSLTADLFPGPFAGIPGSTPTLFAAGPGVIFGNNFGADGIELSFTDGMSSGMLLEIGDDPLSEGSSPGGFARLGDQVLFQATDETVGAELWISDGTPAGTALLKDISPSASPFEGSAPHHIVTFADRAFFFAFHPNFGNELWVSDGTAAGTTLVKDLIPGPVGSEPLFSNAPVALDDAVYFIARQSSGALALFRTDGTSAGTTVVFTVDPTGFIGEFNQLERVNDKLLLMINGQDGLELWASDGTTAGTQQLADMNPGPDGTFLSQIAAGETQAFVSVVPGSVGTQLWVTDGTPLGTHAILTTPDFIPSSFMETVGDWLFFANHDPLLGVEPWTSDGTTTGTQLLLDVVPGPESSAPQEFVGAADRVFFTVQSPTGSFHYQELWMTDGTPAGTGLVASLPSPVAGAGIAGLWAVGSDRRVIFSNVDANGSEWWTSDGTATGTLPVSDIAPGPAFATPYRGSLVGNRVLFGATNGENGPEPHAMPLSATGAFAATKLGAGCAGGNGTPSLSLASGSLGLGDAFALACENALPAAPIVWAFDQGYGDVPALGACEIQLPLPKVLAASVADGGGTSLLPALVPPTPSLVGAQVDLQAFALEAGGAFLGLGSLSDVLELVIGP